MKKNFKYILSISILNIFIILTIINFKISFFNFFILILLGFLAIFLISKLSSKIACELHSKALNNAIYNVDFKESYIDNICKIEQNIFVTIFSILYFPWHIILFFIYALGNNNYLYIIGLTILTIIMALYLKKRNNNFSLTNYYQGLNYIKLANKLEKEKQNARKRFKKFLLKEQETVIFTLIYLILITFLLKDAFVILYMIPLLWGLYNTKNYLMIKEYYKNLQDIEINKSSKTIKDFNKDIVIKNGMIRNFANLNLTIPKNKICMIYGPNLSGKTTILDLLAGNINLDKGEILVDDKVLSPKRLETSYMRYNDYLFSNTIKNMFLEINPNINETRIHFWLRQVNAEYFTYDLKKVILNNGESLTKDEQIKLKMALNLIKDNNILLFDEPFKYFDTNTIKRITANLRYLSNTIIITTNDYKHLKFADLVYIIDDNSVLYQGLYKDIPNNLERKYNL